MAFLGQEEQIREFQDRFKYVYVAVLIGFGFLLSRLVFLQILNGEKMRHYSEENRIKRVKIAAPRGMIFDRNRKILIDNHPAFDLEIIPQYLRESKQTDPVVAQLAKLVNMPKEEIHAILKKHRQQPAFMPVKIKTDLTRDEVAAIESWKISMPGVQVSEEIKRTNVHAEIASHLLGYIGEVNSHELPTLNKNGESYKLGDSIGKFGLEQRMEHILRGVNGERLVEVDALGRTKLGKSKGRFLEGELEKPAIPGKNLILTIDQDLQEAATKAFGEQIGSLVAIDPRNGEILAMISRPSFDPTEFARGISHSLWKKIITNENRPLRDRTLQDHYPPGSTFKVVTAIAALEEGLIDENTTFHCSGSMRFGNRPYHCHKRQGHGEVNVVSAITQSCDIFFWRVIQKFKTIDDLAKWAVHLGLGSKTGINLAREVPGLIPTEAWKQKRFNQPWHPGDSLPVAIGQGYVLTTTLQLANLYASIANGGTQYRPYLVKEIESNDGQVLQAFKPDVVDQTRLQQRSYDLVKKGLWGVVNSPNGTTYSKRLPGMDFVGKTGTAQVIRLSADRIYGKCQNMRFRDRHHGLFAGYAPVNDPKIAVAVIVEHGCSGSGAAAPIAREVVKTYLEKYYPDLYGEKALAAKLKGQSTSIPVVRSREEDTEDMVSLDNDNLPEPVEPVQEELLPPPPAQAPPVPEGLVTAPGNNDE